MELSTAAACVLVLREPGCLSPRSQDDDNPSPELSNRAIERRTACTESQIGGCRVSTQSKQCCKVRRRPTPGMPVPTPASVEDAKPAAILGLPSGRIRVSGFTALATGATQPRRRPRRWRTVRSPGPVAGPCPKGLEAVLRPLKSDSQARTNKGNALRRESVSTDE